MHFLCQKSQVISAFCLRAVKSYFFSIRTETYHRLSNLLLRLFWSNSQHSALSSSDVMQGKSKKAKYNQRPEGDKAARYSKKFSEERVALTPFPLSNGRIIDDVNNLGKFNHKMSNPYKFVSSFILELKV